VRCSDEYHASQEHRQEFRSIADNRFSKEMANE
jgi:hypothetical protein